MAIASAALVVAVGGAAFAAGGGFAGPDGVIHGCVAQKDILNQLTDPVIGGVSQAITPKGSLIVVAPGAKCPAGYAALDFNQTGPAGPAGPGAASKIVESSSSSVGLGPKAREIDSKALPIGSMVVANGHVVVKVPRALPAATLVECWLSEGHGRVVAGSKVGGTLAADEPDAEVTLPINAVFPHVVGGDVTLDCKSTAAKPSSPASRSSVAAAAASQPIAGDGLGFDIRPGAVPPLPAECRKYIKDAITDSEAARKAGGVSEDGAQKNRSAQAWIDLATYHCGTQAATVTGPLSQASAENEKAHNIYRKGGTSRAAVDKAFKEAETAVLGYLKQALPNVVG